LAIIQFAHYALPPYTERVSADPTVQSSRTALFNSPQMRPPSSWPGSICHLPPALGGPT